MRRRHQLIPTAPDSLEGRIVPSHATAVRLVDGPSPRASAAEVARAPSSIGDRIDQDFDSFRADYDQARATFFSSIQNQPAPSPATTYAFTAYTTQRTSLLAQEVLGTVGQARLGAGRGRALRHLVATKIIGPRDQMPPGSLAQALLASTPQPGTTAPTASLYSLSEDAAIESARVAILNGAGPH